MVAEELPEIRMADPTKDITPDTRRINLDDMHDVRSWMFNLGCTEAELRLAVRDAGDRAEDVRAYLLSRKST
jgi:hypothetical protein